MSVLLSIYIPTYNRVSLLEKQLVYLIEETAAFSDEIEIVISDNASTDGTRDMVKRVIKDTRIRYYRNDVNEGIVANAYKAVAMTRGEYLWTLSDDDILRKGTVDHVISILKTYPDISFLFLNYTKDSLGCEPMWPYPFEQEYYRDGFSELIKHYPIGLEMIIMTSAFVCLRRAVELSEKILSLDETVSYGLHFFSSLAAMKMGASFFDKDVWVKAGENDSWTDIVYKAHTGWRKSVLRLSKIGYTRMDIHIINKYILVGRWFEECIHEYKTHRSISRLLRDYSYFVFHAPQNALSILFFHPYNWLLMK